MKKIILLSITTFLLIGCKQELNNECESLAKVSEQTDRNRSEIFNWSDADVAIVKKILSSHVSLDAEGVFSSISDTLTVLSP